MTTGKTDTKEFITELDEIFESMQSVKGREYANAVQQLFCMQNVHAGLLFIIAKVIQQHAADIDIEGLNKVVQEMEVSLTHEISHLLIPVIAQRDLLKLIEQDKEIGARIYSCKSLISEMNADIEILNKKQREYQLDAGAMK